MTGCICRIMAHRWPIRFPTRGTCSAEGCGERAILDQGTATPLSVPELSRRLYRKTEPWLVVAAERNIEAHLDKLLNEGLVKPDGANWRAI